MLRRTALSESEVELFRAVYREIVEVHYDRVWRVLRRGGVPDAALDDLVQDVFATFYYQVVEAGFPDSIGRKLHANAEGKALNQRRRAKRDPTSLGLPSSTSERPARSAPEIERAMDYARVARRLLPALSPEHREVVQAVILGEQSHEEAAEALGIKRPTLTMRLMAARRKLAEMVALFLPESQRGPV